jgi:hypothetical protein
VIKTGVDNAPTNLQITYVPLSRETLVSAVFLFASAFPFGEPRFTGTTNLRLFGSRRSIEAGRHPKRESLLNADGVVQFALGKFAAELGDDSIPSVCANHSFAHSAPKSPIQKIERDSPLLLEPNVLGKPRFSKTSGIRGPFGRQVEAELQRNRGLIPSQTQADRDLAVARLAKRSALAR